MNATRTTISLPTRVLSKLQRYTKKPRGVQYLTKLCLARFIQTIDLSKWNSKVTCSYNKETCAEIIDMYFLKEEFRILKTIRISQSISLSLLITMAVDKYLEKILAILSMKSSNHRSKWRKTAWWRWLHSIYDQAAFKITHNKSKSLTRISIVIRQNRFNRNIF